MSQINVDIVKLEQASRGFFESRGIRVVNIDGSVATLSMEIKPDELNPYGIVFGGDLYSLADCAAQMAAHMDGRIYVTRSGNLSFLSNRDKGTVCAKATVLHRSNTLCLCNVLLTTEKEDILAAGQFDCYALAKGNKIL